MKNMLLTGFAAILCAGISSQAALGYELLCKDIANNYQLTVQFPNAPNNGENKAEKATLLMNGYQTATFDNCVLTVGAQTTLHCGNRASWEVNANIGGFDAGNLTRSGRIIGTLTCKL